MTIERVNKRVGQEKIGNLDEIIISNLQSFKTLIHYTLNSDPIPEISSSFHDTWVNRGLQKLYAFGATSKNNKKTTIYG